MSIRVYRMWFAVPLACALMSVPAGARGADRMVVGIDTVEVTATPIMAEEDITLYAGTVTTVGRRQIEDLNAQDLPSALRLLPGVTISRYNLLGSYGGGEGGSVYIRGQGAGRPGSEIKVYVDGAPREAGVWSHPVMDIVPTDYASAIDVHKGPQPHSYPGTFGTVDLRTVERVSPGYETSFDITLGEFSTRSGVLRHGGKVQAFDYYLGGTYKRSDGHRPHADGKIGSLFLRMGVDVSAGLRASYVLQHTDNWSRDPGQVDGPVPERDRFATGTLTHNVKLEHDAVGSRGYALLYYEDGQIRWEKDHLSGPETPAGNSDTDWKNYGFRGSEDVTRGNLGLTAGFEIESEGGDFRNTTLSGHVPFSYEGRFTTVAPALAGRYRVGLGQVALVPSAGLRYYRHSRFSSETAPHAGLVLEWDDHKVFAGYARGVNYPGVYAIGVAPSTIDTLAAEVLDHVEAGFNAGWGTRVRLQVSVFHDRAENLLQYSQAGLVNVRDYEVFGMDLSSTLSPRPDLSLYAALTLLNPKNEKTPRAPEFSASAGINYRLLSGLRLNLDLEYVAEQYAFNGRSSDLMAAGVEEIGRYFIANVGVGYDASGMLPFRGELMLALENLTGEEYSFQPGYPMPGRTVFLAVRMGSGR